MSKGVYSYSNMASFGYTLMCEQRSPVDLVREGRAAEAAGFDFAVISDHFHPWLDVQGHSPFAWSVLGALAEVTDRMGLMTMVTCPTTRYHPAIVAQMAATVAVMSGGRFQLGVGAGEKLNEHVVGGIWPSAAVRHEMLAEAIEIMRRLWQGGFQAYQGEHFELSDACLYTLPERPIRVHVAAGGPEAARLAAELGDGLIASEPRPDLVRAFRQAGGQGRPHYGQVAVCYDESEQGALRTARDLWRFSVSGWKVMSELPNPVNFDAASRTVRPEDVAELVPCGPDPERHLAGIRRFLDAGFDHVAIVQVGQNQDGFLRFWREELRPRLERAGTPSAAAP
jgi:G6PDH family F420-dependent oxidoreductase